MENSVLSLLNDYPAQAGRLVRTQICSSEHGEAYLLVFDSDTGLSAHEAPYDAMAQIVDGKVDFTTEGITMHLHRGDTILMRKGAIHSVAASEPARMLLTFFK